MKRLLSIVLIALFATTAVHAELSMPRKDYVKRFESCEAILREFMYHPQYAIPKEVLRAAKAIVITNQFKAGFFLGLKDGYGVILSRRADGSWSNPGLLNAGEASFGLQIGGTAIETIYILTDDSTPRILYKGRFNIGVDAKAVAGPKVAEAERITKEMLDTPILVYSKNKGLFAGVSVRGGWLQANNNAIRSFYNTRYTLPELLQGDWVENQPETDPLVQYVTEITR
jgi:lipid-binding SYLF domain-containing protein